MKVITSKLLQHKERITLCALDLLIVGTVLLMVLALVALVTLRWF